MNLKIMGKKAAVTQFKVLSQHFSVGIVGNYENTFTIDGFHAGICAQDLPNMKHEC
jgi:hypothetical protein